MLQVAHLACLGSLACTVIPAWLLLSANTFLQKELADARSARRLETFSDVEERASMLTSSGCIKITSDIDLNVASKSCGGRGCPPCVVFPWEDSSNELFFHLERCSTAYVAKEGSATLGSADGHFSSAAVGWTFINYRNTDVVVKSGSASAPICKYRGREFSGRNGDYEDLSGRCDLAALGGAFSVAFTARSDDASLTWRRIFELGAAPMNSVVYVSQAEEHSKLRFSMWDSSNTERFKLEVPDAFAHVERRYLLTLSTAGGLRMWIDGAPVITAFVGGSPASGPLFMTGASGGVEVTSRSVWYVGRGQSTNSNGLWWNGLIRDVWFWNTEVTSWYDAVGEHELRVPAMRSKSAFCVSTGAGGSEAADWLIWDSAQ